MFDLLSYECFGNEGSEKEVGMERIKVSIIVPVYNVQEYLEECLSSLMTQSFKDIEIILINDGSSDNSPYICEQFSNIDARFVVVHQKNAGQSIARNNGLKIAKGEYVIYIDSDDYVHEDMCLILYNTAKEFDLDIVHGDILNEKNRITNDLNFRSIPSENRVITGVEYLKESLEYNSYDIVPWLNLIRRKYLIENNLFFIENCFYEDQDFTLKLLTMTNNRFMKIRFPFYYYRMNREGSVTNTYALKNGIDLIKVMASMIEYINSKNISEKKYLYTTVNIALYHLSNIWLKMDRYNRKCVINLLREGNYICKYGLLYNNYKLRMKFQNILFCSCPQMLLFLSTLYGNTVRKDSKWSTIKR